MTTPPVTLAARPHPRTALPVAPPAGESLPSGDVIDLDSERRTRRPDLPDLPNTSWVCPECRLSAGPFWPDEATLLAALHDQVFRHPPATAVPIPGA